MFKSGMGRGREYMINQTSLLDSLEPLQYRRIYHRHFVTGEKLISKQRIIKDFWALGNNIGLEILK
jgi:hypothetical protein